MSVSMGPFSERVVSCDYPGCAQRLGVRNHVHVLRDTPEDDPRMHPGLKGWLLEVADDADVCDECRPLYEEKLKGVLTGQ